MRIIAKQVIMLENLVFSRLAKQPLMLVNILVFLKHVNWFNMS